MLNFISGINSKNCKTVFENDFPAQSRGLIVRAIKSGFNMTEELYKSESWLAWRVGEDFHKYFRRIAVEYQINKFIENGLLKNLSCSISDNTIGNYRHIEIFGNNSTYTVSQTDNSKALPRMSVFRKKLALQSSQLSFDFSGNGEIEFPNYYGLITYGSKSLEPQFVNIGFPDVNLRGWIFQNELLEGPHQIHIPEKEIITVEKDTLVSFKSEREKVIDQYERKNS